MPDDAPHIDPAIIARERRAEIAKLIAAAERHERKCDELAGDAMTRAEVDEAAKWRDMATHKRVVAICLHLGLRE